MAVVQVRKDGNTYLVYFIKSRRVLETNKIGAKIVELFFNHNKKINEIVDILVIKYQQPREVVYNDAILFLKKLRDEMALGGFNLIQEQNQLDTPLAVELEITLRCNLNCRHCFNNEHKDKFMQLDQIKSIINVLVNSGVFEVNIIGGEPFKHPNLLEILRFCNSIGVTVTLVTNGTLITEEIAIELSSFENIVLAVSVDGVGKKHDYIRGKGQFKRVDKVIGILIKHNIPFEVLCTLSSHNIAVYKEIILYCDNIGIPCNFNLFKPTRKEHTYLTASPEDIFGITRELFEMRRSKKYMIGFSNAAITSELLNLPTRNECKASKAGLVIDVNGRMVTCPLLVESGYYDNVELPEFNDNYLETWHGHKVFQNFRNGNMLECQARAFIFSGDVNGYDPYGIQAFREYCK